MSESEGCTCCQTRWLAGQTYHECARCGHYGKSHVGCNAPGPEPYEIRGNAAVCVNCGKPWHYRCPSR